MATQCFLRDVLSLATCDRCSLGTNATKLNGSAVGWFRPFPVRLTRGSGGAINQASTVTGPTSGIEIIDAGGAPLQWITPPLDADVTIAGTITFNLWASEVDMSANVAINCIVERLDHTGAVLSTIVKTARTTEVAVTTRAAANFTATPTSTACNKGDRLRIRVFGDDAGTMATGFTFDFGYNGGTAGADGDSYVTFTETFGFLTTNPTTTSVYLTDTASDVATAAVDRETWTSRGAGVQTDVTNTAAGWTAPLQVTDTAGGTVVDWWTKGLTAFTLAAPVLVNLRGLESNAAANAALRCEVAVTANDGSGATVWAATSFPTELTTSEAAYVFYLAGDDIAVTDGQRLRVRIYADDATDVAMAASQTVTIHYAGTSGGASGDAFLTFGQTLTEYVVSSDPRTKPSRYVKNDAVHRSTRW